MGCPFPVLLIGLQLHSLLTSLGWPQLCFLGREVLPLLLGCVALSSRVLKVGDGTVLPLQWIAFFQSSRE